MECLSFSISGRMCAVPRNDVQAVTFMVAFNARAELPSIVLGEARWRGYPLLGLDLARLFGEMDHCYETGARLLICGNGERYCALLADTVSEIITLDPTTVLTPLARLFHPGSSDIPLLDVASVFTLLNDWEGSWT